jgi:hypothetical protein
VKVTLEPIDTTVRVMLGDVKSGPAASKALAAFAWQEFAKAASHNQRALGYLPEHETWVDGRKGAQPESVKPDGRIVFEFELSDDTIEWIAAMLELHSPIGPPVRGHYAEDHKWFADGSEFDPHGRVPPADRYIAVNVRPYARKLEGSNNRPPLSLQSPHGVYQVVAAMAQERFKRSHQIKYTFETVNGERNPAIRITPR